MNNEILAKFAHRGDVKKTEGAFILKTKSLLKKVAMQQTEPLNSNRTIKHPLLLRHSNSIKAKAMQDPDLIILLFLLLPEQREFFFERCETVGQIKEIATKLAKYPNPSEEASEIISEINKKPGNWGKSWWPITATSGQGETIEALALRAVKDPRMDEQLEKLGENLRNVAIKTFSSVERIKLAMLLEDTPKERADVVAYDEIQANQLAKIGPLRAKGFRNHLSNHEQSREILELAKVESEYGAQSALKAADQVIVTKVNNKLSQAQKDVFKALFLPDEETQELVKLGLQESAESIPAAADERIFGKILEPEQKKALLVFHSPAELIQKMPELAQRASAESVRKAIEEMILKKLQEILKPREVQSKALFAFFSPYDLMHNMTVLGPQALAKSVQAAAEKMILEKLTEKLGGWLKNALIAIFSPDELIPKMRAQDPRASEESARKVADEMFFIKLAEILRQDQIKALGALFSPDELIYNMSVLAPHASAESIQNAADEMIIKKLHEQIWPQIKAVFAIFSPHELRENVPKLVSQVSAENVQKEAKEMFLKKLKETLGPVQSEALFAIVSPDKLIQMLTKLAQRASAESDQKKANEMIIKELKEILGPDQSEAVSAIVSPFGLVQKMRGVAQEAAAKSVRAAADEMILEKLEKILRPDQSEALFAIFSPGEVILKVPELVSQASAENIQKPADEMILKEVKNRLRPDQRGALFAIFSPNEQTQKVIELAQQGSAENIQKAADEIILKNPEKLCQHNKGYVNKLIKEQRERLGKPSLEVFQGLSEQEQIVIAREKFTIKEVEQYAKLNLARPLYLVSHKVLSAESIMGDVDHPMDDDLFFAWHERCFGEM